MTITKVEKGTEIEIKGIPVVLHEDAFVETTSKTQSLMRGQFTSDPRKRSSTQSLSRKTALINCSLFKA